MPDPSVGQFGGCPHCPDGHRKPGSKPMSVWVGPERDHDGQPTTLHVEYAAGHHVSEAEAQWLRELIASSHDMIPVTDPSEIPQFASEAEEAAFWDTHEITDELWDRLPQPPPGTLPVPRGRRPDDA